MTIHHWLTPTISTNQTTHGHQNCLLVFLISGQGYFTFLYWYAKHNWEGERKEEQNHGLGLAPSATGRSLWHFCAALCAFVGYRGRIFARNSHKATRTADSFSCIGQPELSPQVLAATFLTSVNWSPLCPALITWLTCSVNWSLLAAPFCWLLCLVRPLLPIILFSWLCPPLFSGTFLLLSTSGLMGDIIHKHSVWVLRQNRQRDCLTGTHTTNAQLCVTIAVHALFSVDETLLLKYVNLSTDFREPQFIEVEMSPF